MLLHASRDMQRASARVHAHAKGAAATSATLSAYKEPAATHCFKLLPYRRTRNVCGGHRCPRHRQRMHRQIRQLSLVNTSALCKKVVQCAAHLCALCHKLGVAVCLVLLSNSHLPFSPLKPSSDPRRTLISPQLNRTSSSSCAGSVTFSMCMTSANAASPTKYGYISDSS